MASATRGNQFLINAIRNQGNQNSGFGNQGYNSGYGAGRFNGGSGNYGQWGNNSMVSNSVKFFSRQIIEGRSDRFDEESGEPIPVNEDPKCEIVAIATNHLGLGDAMRLQRIHMLPLRCGDDPVEAQQIADLFSSIMTLNMPMDKAVAICKIFSEVLRVMDVHVESTEQFLNRQPTQVSKPKKEPTRKTLFRHPTCDDDDPEELCSCGKALAVCGACGRGWAQRAVNESQPVPPQKPKLAERLGAVSAASESLVAELVSRFSPEDANAPKSLQPFRSKSGATGSGNHHVISTPLPSARVPLPHLEASGNPAELKRSRSDGDDAAIEVDGVGGT